jgi:hypothetical protein
VRLPGLLTTSVSEKQFFACMNRNMQAKIHRSATTYSVQNSISDTLIPITHELDRCGADGEHRRIGPHGCSYVGLVIAPSVPSTLGRARFQRRSIIRGVYAGVTKS